MNPDTQYIIATSLVLIAVAIIWIQIGLIGRGMHKDYMEYLEKMYYRNKD
jgi:hypothetical protein